VVQFSTGLDTRRLAWGGNAWHAIEFAIALGAGIAAGSVVLVGFGADSLIEVFSGSVIAWLFTAGRLCASPPARDDELGPE